MKPIVTQPEQDAWIQTYNGGVFYPFAPRESDVAVTDIAHALSNTCRYGGHSCKFYSVAEHSFLVAKVAGEACDPTHRSMLWAAVCMLGLLHDASEAYLQDLVTPIKRHLPAYVELETPVQNCIISALGAKGLVTMETLGCVAEADRRIVVDEVAALYPMGARGDWVDALGAGYGIQVNGWRPEIAKELWLGQYRFLVGQLRDQGYKGMHVVPEA